MIVHSMIRPLSVASLLTVLTACGGGGGSSTDIPVTTDPGIPNPISGPAGPSTQGGRTVSALLNDWASSTPLDYTSLSAIPATGSASYDGFLYGVLSTTGGRQTESLIGRLSLDVGFAASDINITGTASDFTANETTPLSGTLTVAGGRLNRGGNPASDATLQGVGVTGTLTGGGDTRVFGLALEGDFLGAQADALGGDALGRVRVDGTDQNFDGGFIAEK